MKRKIFNIYGLWLVEKVHAQHSFKWKLHGLPYIRKIWGNHDDVIKWRHFPRYWPFVRGIRRPPVNSPHKGQWRGALMFSLICAWIDGWVNNREAGDLRCHRAHYDATVMWYEIICMGSIYRFGLIYGYGFHGSAIRNKWKCPQPLVTVCIHSLLLLTCAPRRSIVLQFFWSARKCL